MIKTYCIAKYLLAYTMALEKTSSHMSPNTILHAFTLIQAGFEIEFHCSPEDEYHSDTTAIQDAMKAT